MAAAAACTQPAPRPAPARTPGQGDGGSVERLVDVVISVQDRAPASTGPTDPARARAIAEATAQLPQVAARPGPSSLASPPGVPEGYAVTGLRLDGKDQQVAALVPQGTPTTGDGLYVARPEQGSRPVTIEVPHPRSDAWTDQIGADVYARSTARYLLMAGADRGAGDDADVAHAPDAAFAGTDMLLVRKDWVVVQIHGFTRRRHPGYPDAVVSSGTATPGATATRVARELESQGISTCVYDGTTCADLAARTNVQGQHARAVGADFVHVELERSVRADPALRSRAAQAIATGLG